METNESATSDIEQSPTVGALFKALAAAQDEIEAASKDSVNPHFKSKYADLASVREAAKPAAKHGLSVVQQVVTKPDGTVGLRTVLGHASGEWMASRMWVKPERPGPQAAGSVITYLRRYMLAAVLGIAQDDDDGNAGDRERSAPPRSAAPSTQPQQRPANTQTTKSSHGEDRAEAAGTIERPAGITAAQVDTIGDLFQRLGYSKTGGTTRVKDLTGKKGAFEMNTADAEKVIAALQGELDAKHGAAS